MEKGVVFIAGTYGVGKSTLCDKLCRKLNIPAFSAGDLISEINGETYGKNKVVKNKIANQNILISAVEKKLSLYPTFLLAGHFCIFDKSDEVEILPEFIYEEMPIVKIILLETDFDRILRNIKSRDDKSYNLDSIKNIIRLEREQAEKISSQLNIPLHIHKMDFAESDIKQISCKSEEHIIPKSLGNEEMILPKGIICDSCNNYFAREIEKPFLENETIKLLRTFHTISSRKGNIPPLEIFVNHEISKFEFDAKNNCCYIGLSPETINKICNKEISMLISRGIDTESLRGNYVVSRFLVKIFTETYTYFLYQNNFLKENCFFVFDKKMKELVNYVRQGNKNGKIYNYTVRQYKEIQPFSDDDFIAKITFNFDNKKIIGMTLLIFELEFNLFL